MTVDLTPGPERPTAEPFRRGETLTPARGEAVLTAAAAELLSVGSDLVPDQMGPAVGRWLIGLADAVGVTGSDIDDEMLGGLALANIVLRAREGDPAYQAGREDAAKAVEAAPAGLTMKSLSMFAGIQLDGGEYLRRDKAADVARGAKQPRTPEARGDSEHTQDGGE